MTVLEKAGKALEFLKNHEKIAKIHELQSAASTLGRCMGTLGCKSTFSRHYLNLLHPTLPILLSLAGNESAEIRLAGDEALNRTVVGGYSFNSHYVNLQFQSLIDPEKSIRWNRAAISRICLGEKWLRPGHGRLRHQIQTVLPKLVAILNKCVDMKQLTLETMECNIDRIMSGLAEYCTDDEIIELVNAFCRHVNDEQPPVRRAAGSCLSILAKHKKFVVKKLTCRVIENLWPECNDSNQVLGWFGVLKCYLHNNILKDAAVRQSVFHVDDFMEVYQLCIHYLESSHFDHNIYNAVLDCLYILLNTANGCYKSALLSVNPNYVVIGSKKRDGKHSRCVSSLSIAGRSIVSNVSSTQLSDDNVSIGDVTENLSFSGGLCLGSMSQLQTPRRSIDDLSFLQSPDSPTSDVNMELSVSELLNKDLTDKLEDLYIDKDDSPTDGLIDEAVSEEVQAFRLNIGTSLDEDIPLKYCFRLLTSKFLLTGSSGGVIPDRTVRVSVKASAINCLSAMLNYFPEIIMCYLDKDVELEAQLISATIDTIDTHNESTNQFIIERNICFQDSITDSFSQELNCSYDSYNQSRKNTPQNRKEPLKSVTESSTKDIPSNILDSKQSLGESTNPNLTNSNFTMSNSDYPTEYPMSSSVDVLTSSVDLDIKADHFAEPSDDNFTVFNVKEKQPLRKVNDVTKDCIQTIESDSMKYDHQMMFEIFILFEKHSDPHIRGLIRIGIGNYLRAVLELSYGDYGKWGYCQRLSANMSDVLSVDGLIDIILKGLSDDVHSCVSHSLSALTNIINPILLSRHSLILPKVLNELILIERNNYWLCKVNLCKFYEVVDYQRLCMACDDYNIRSNTISECLFRLLADKDNKVRSAASNAIIRIIPQIIKQKKSTKCKILIDLYQAQNHRINFECSKLSLENIKKEYFLCDLPQDVRHNMDGVCIYVKCFIVELLARYMESSCKHFKEGVLECLHAILTKWPPWSQYDSYVDQSILDLFLDVLNCGNNTVFSSILIIELCTMVYPVEIRKCMSQQKLVETPESPTSEKWQFLAHEHVGRMAEKFMQIILKMLNICMHLIDDINPSVYSNRGVIGLPGSPVRKKTQEIMPKRSNSTIEVDDRGSLRKKTSNYTVNMRANFVGHFVNDPFYSQLYDSLRSIYSNHKVNVDSSSSMFSKFLRCILNALAVQLEMSTESEYGYVTEEILYYLKSIINIECDKVVFCVTQLLKCLFGTNMANQFDSYMNLFNQNSNVESNKHFGDILFDTQQENNKMSEERNLYIKLDNFSRIRNDKKWLTNKKILERYIQLFEGIVVQSLKIYTTQNNIKMQCEVLHLLKQMLSLRINYCMLDNEQVFIGFVLKQLELIEQGEIPNSLELVRSIVIFLVQLASSKYNTKQIMEIPKVIQLCDGLLACSCVKECIQGLGPLVLKVFSSLSLNHIPSMGKVNQQEEQVTREVVFYMLQKTMTHYNVLNLMSAVLCLSQEHSENYREWSERALDSLLPLLSQHSVELNTRVAIVALEKLFDSIHSDVLKEQSKFEAVLKILFQKPPDQNCSSIQIKERYLATILVLIRKFILKVPESETLLSINYLKATHISPTSIFFNVKNDIDPLNVHNVNENCANLESDIILVRFLLKTLTYAILELTNMCERDMYNMELVSETDDNTLLYYITIALIHAVKDIFHLNDNCLFPLSSQTAQTVIQNEQSSLNTGLYSPEENIPLDKLNFICLRHMYRAPILTVEWSLLLLRLKFLDQSYWQHLLGALRSDVSSANGKESVPYSVLNVGCFLAFAEYFIENGLKEAVHFSWLLVNRIHILVECCDEPIVKKFIHLIHENSSASGLLLQAVAARCQNNIKGEFALKTYKVLQNCHPSQSGALIFLICRVMGKQLVAYGKLYENLAIDRCESLAQLSYEQMEAQLCKDDLHVVFELVKRDKIRLRYPTLIKVLNRFATTIYDMSPLDLTQERSINPHYIATTNVNDDWLLNQMKFRCCQSLNNKTPKVQRYDNLAEVLINLNEAQLNTIFTCPEFDRGILRACFKVSCDEYLKEFVKQVSIYEAKEVERQNGRFRANKLAVMLRDDNVSNLDSNIFIVANNFVKFKKSEHRSQFFIPISNSNDEKFGNLQFEDEPIDLKAPELPTLFKSSLAALDRMIATVLKLFPKQSRPLSQSENFNLSLDQTMDKYMKRCHQVFKEKLFHTEFCIIHEVLEGFLQCIVRIQSFLDSITYEVKRDIMDSILSTGIAKNLAHFSIVSLQYLSFLIKNKSILEGPQFGDVSFRSESIGLDVLCIDNVLYNTLSNIGYALSFDEIWSFLNLEGSSNRIQSAISCVYAIVKYVVKDFQPLVLKHYVNHRDDKNLYDYSLVCNKLVSVIEYWECNVYGRVASHYKHDISSHFREHMERILCALSRLQLMNTVALIPPIVWPSVDITVSEGQLPKVELPMQALQDMDVFEQFLFRINIIGWSSKKQFEEIWMALLGSLQGNGVHWAFRGVMELLLSTLPRIRCSDGTTKSMCCPNRFFDDCNGMQILRGIVVSDVNCSRLFDHIDLERIPFIKERRNNFNYHYGQFSSEYLRLAAGITNDAHFKTKNYVHRKQNSIDVDLQSCLHLLTDIVSEMLSVKSEIGVSAKCMVLACIVNISDLFSTTTEWNWLSQQLVTLTSSDLLHFTQYSVVGQYLLYGLSKTLTVLEADVLGERLSSVYQKLVKSLNSIYAPLRQSALHGCLLQLRIKTVDVTGSSRMSSESYDQMVKQLISNVTLYLVAPFKISLYEQSLYWTILFTLVEQGHFDLMNTAIEFILKHPSHFCAELVLKGITSMIRLSVLPKDLKKTLIKQLVEQHSHLNENHKVMLLMVHLFSADSKLVSPRLITNVSNMDPEVLMSSMERLTQLYRSLRECNAASNQRLCVLALKYHLRETLPPVATLSRVVIEFLECCREAERHTNGLLSDKNKWLTCSRMNAEMVFEVFETGISQNQLPTMTGWIFEALCHLLIGKISNNLLPYTLLNLLVSATPNEHLRKLSPVTYYILHEAGVTGASMCFANRRLLCTVSLHSMFTREQLIKLRELCHSDCQLVDLDKCLNLLL